MRRVPPLPPIQSVENDGRLLALLIYLCLLAGAYTVSVPHGWLIRVRDVGLCASMLAFMLWIPTAKTRLPQHASTSVIVPINLLILYQSFSTLWAPGALAISDLVDLLSMLILLNLGAAVFARLPASSMDAVWNWTWYTAAIFLVGALIQGPGQQARYSAFGGGPNVFVRIMIIGMVAGLALYVSRGQPWRILALPAFLIGAILSGSRGGLVSLAVLAAAAIPVVQRIGRKGMALIFMAIFSVGLIVYQVAPRSIVDNLYSRYVTLTLEERYDSGRSIYFSAALDMFKERPFAGWGVGSFTEMTGLHYPHNIVLAVAAEGGTIGLLLLSVAVLYPLWVLLRHRPAPSHALFAYVASACVFIASLFSGGYYDTRFLWYFGVLAGMSAHSQRTASEFRRLV